MLAPPAYWTQPVGALMGAFIAVGVVASVISLAGLIGRRRQVEGAVVSVNSEGDITEITCRLDGTWESHRAGQFAFITFSRLEGAHPFTIASADRNERTITFFIKGLGNYTRNREHDHFVGRLQALCAALPGIRLHIHSSQHGDVLTAGALQLADDQRNKAEIWFCGPRGLADALKKGLNETWNGSLRFHQEAFELR